MSAPTKRAAVAPIWPILRRGRDRTRSTSTSGRKCSPSIRSVRKPGSLATKTAFSQVASHGPTSKAGPRSTGVSRARSWKQQQAIPRVARSVKLGTMRSVNWRSSNGPMLPGRSTMAAIGPRSHRYMMVRAPCALSLAASTLDRRRALSSTASTASWALRLAAASASLAAAALAAAPASFVLTWLSCSSARSASASSCHGISVPCSASRTTISWRFGPLVPRRALCFVDGEFPGGDSVSSMAYNGAVSPHTPHGPHGHYSITTAPQPPRLRRLPQAACRCDAPAAEIKP